MGTLSEMHRRGRIPRGRGRKPKGPLRRVVGTVDKGIGTYPDIYERLECGHEQRPARDFIGITNAARRRCKQCGKEALAAQSSGAEGAETGASE